MGHCVRMILPDGGSQRHEIMDEIIRRWGGVTAFTGRGWWKSDNGNVVFESVDIIEVSIERWTQQIHDWWMDLSDRVREMLGQDCVFLSVRSETAWLIGHDGHGPTEEVIGS